jgi:predicted acetyltransferase
MPVEIVEPELEKLPAFVDALERGWSPDNVRGRAAAEEQLARIHADAESFVASLDDPLAAGAPVTLPDGSTVPRLPGFHRWIWDGEYCGSINLRWQNGISQLPAHVLGHIGYSVVPWKQGRGYATRALHLLLPEARAQGLDYVELTTDPDNIPSQRVILANHGILIERFRKASAYGSKDALRWRIPLANAKRAE